MVGKTRFFSFLFLLFSMEFSAQNFTADFIKSVQIKTGNSENSSIVNLTDRILFSFDDLEADQKTYAYEIKHCDYDWTPSNINESEYIEGYARFEIQDFKTSFNTLQNFTHHYFQIPNENTRIKTSGNYLLTIFNQEGEICIQRRLVIYEHLVAIRAKNTRDRSPKNLSKKQVVQFSIVHPNLVINHPAKELKIYILQNEDWNFTRKNLRPQFYKKNEISYQYNDETSFFGRNEFLHFDSKNITATNVNIAQVSLRKNGYHTHLYPAIFRAALPYTYAPDINGNFHIQNIHAYDQETESDYTWVHFALDTQSVEFSDKIYVYGGFNNYALHEENALKFNKNTQQFETAIQLKQGFYNYTFATKEKDQVTTRFIEGSFFETENTYTVIAYYHPFATRTYRVIGMAKINSNL